MSIIVSDTGGGNFTPHPEGQYPAKCVDVVDVGWVSTDWGPKYRVRLVFFCGETEEKMIDGERKTLPLCVFATFTATLSERGNLRPFLESWRGRLFTADELGRFDMEKLLHAPAFLQVQHRQVSTGKVYANVKTIMKLPPNMTAPDTPADFQRAKDREGWTGPNPHPDMETSGSTDGPERAYAGGPGYHDGDADLPFAPTRLWAPLFFGW